MVLTAAHISPIIALIAGILISDFAAIVELRRCHLPYRYRAYRAEWNSIISSTEATDNLQPPWSVAI